jgi:hypothetical protein
MMPFGALRHFAPKSRDFFVGQPNGDIGRLVRQFVGLFRLMSALVRVEQSAS